MFANLFLALRHAFGHDLLCLGGMFVVATRLAEQPPGIHYFLLARVSYQPPMLLDVAIVATENARNTGRSGGWT